MVAVDLYITDEGRSNREFLESIRNRNDLAKEHMGKYVLVANRRYEIVESLKEAIELRCGRYSGSGHAIISVIEPSDEFTDSDPSPLSWQLRILLNWQSFEQKVGRVPDK